MLKTLLTLLVVALVCAAPAAAQPSGNLELVSNEAGQVTFSATWDGLKGNQDHQRIVVTVQCGTDAERELANVATNTTQPLLATGTVSGSCIARLYVFRQNSDKIFFTTLDQVELSAG